MKKLLVCIMLLVLAQPYIALAAPLAGANSDVGIFYDSENMVEDTTDANDNDVDGDISWILGGMNYVYIGHDTTQFNEVFFDISSASPLASGMEYDLNVYYYNGSTWDLLTTVPGNENPFRATGLYSFSFAIPGDWTMTTPEGSEGVAPAYYIRFGDGAQESGVDQISLFTIGGGGGGGGAGVPEFSTYMYLLSLGLGGLYIYQQVQKQQKNSLS